MQGDTKNTDSYIAGLPTWQQDNLKLFRRIVHSVYPEIGEEIKWGVPVFLINKKMVFAMSAFKAHTKYNFIFNGAQLNDPHSLFNNGLESKKSRSIDLRENESINDKHLEDLVKASIASLS